jgi:hypothetical protein
MDSATIMLDFSPTTIDNTSVTYHLSTVILRLRILRPVRTIAVFFLSMVSVNVFFVVVCDESMKNLFACKHRDIIRIYQPQRSGGKIFSLFFESDSLHIDGNGRPV